MRTPHWLSAFVLALGGLAAGADPAEACSCIGGPTPCQAFSQSPIVFVGEVLSSQEDGSEFHMRLRVVRALKGITEPIAELWSDAHSSCGMKLKEGKRYVVYTSLIDGRMSIHACGYGHALAPGEPEPELPPVVGSVYGRVFRADVDLIDGFKPLEPIPSVRITIDLPAGDATATTDPWGRFQFAKVPPGRHALTVDAGQGLVGGRFGEVDMPNGEACIENPLILRPSGTISGRVVTADGQPAVRVNLRLRTDSLDDPLVQSINRMGTTDREGRFTFDGLVPDTYLVAVNPDPGDASGQQPYAPAWFGGAARDTATRIPLAEGGTIELDRPFVLPPPLATRTFTLAVSCRDGSVPPAVRSEAMVAGSARFAERDDGEGPLRTLTLVRDWAYTLTVTIHVPDMSERYERRREVLAPIELAAGTPGRHIGVVAPFTSCDKPVP